MLLSNTRPRPTFGLLISHIDGTYQMRFWRGLQGFCERNDCDLVVYASRLWRGQVGSFRDQEAVYRLADANRIDALCVDTSAFRNLEDLDAYLAETQALTGIPIVYSSIGGVERLRVMTDNRGGIRQAMEHLIDAHGCTRFAFVGGQPDIEDARLRREAFLECARDRGLTVEPDWVIDATFDAPSGKAAARSLLTCAAGLPEAIVCANDLMALGAMETLKAHGIDVPGRVRVTGFDDVDLCMLSQPTLSTVVQHIEEKAEVAGKAMLDAVNGLPVGKVPDLPVRFAPRESCGCAREPAAAGGGSGRNADRQLFELKHAITGISQVTEFLGSVLSLGELSARLGKLIPILGMGPTYACLNDGDASAGLPTKYCHLISAIDADGNQKADPNRPRRFLSSQIVPAMLREGSARADLFVQSLYKSEKHFGFLITEFAGTDPAVLVALRDQISEVLLNVQHVRDLDEGKKELRQVLDRATESERRFRELAQSLPTFIMETGEAGEIAYLNNTAMGLLGVTAAEVEAGLNVSEFLAKTGEVREGIADRGYRDIALTSRAGRKVSLLMRTAPIEAGSSRLSWSGLDYKPILESLTQPDPRFIERFGLTKREAQVLTLELRGLVAKEIASELSISLSTVKGHLGIMYRKLGVGSRNQLFGMFGKEIVSEYGFESLIFAFLSEVLRK